jgi:predicted RNA-binding Zn-ribbon protein involved in translation (DUF1610 family)
MTTFGCSSPSAARSVLHHLARLAEHQQPEVRGQALAALGQAATEAVPYFAWLAGQAQDPQVRLAAAGWLARNGSGKGQPAPLLDPPVVQQLEETLHDRFYLSVWPTERLEVGGLMAAFQGIEWSGPGGARGGAPEVPTVVAGKAPARSQGPCLAEGALGGGAVALGGAMRQRRGMLKYAMACPRCGEETYRSHRGLWERRLTTFVPLRPFFCPDCGWRGWRWLR